MRICFGALSLSLVVAFLSCGRHGDVSGQGFRKMTALAERGDLQAQYWLSVQYEDGRGGVKVDPALAFFWRGRAAEGGFPDAQYAYGLSYEKGVGVKPDLPTAIRWYKRCSENGSGVWQSESLVKLAVMTWDGVATGLDPIAAYELVARSALQKNPYACCMLGILHLRPGFKPEDERIAKVLFEVGATQGFSRSQFYLGGLLWKGAYIDHDLPLAASLMMKAADQGYADAQFVLSRFYAEGIGVSMDIGKSRIWLQKALDGGSKDATLYVKKNKYHAD